MKIESISISSDQINEMKKHVQNCLPEEGCGILTGLNGDVKTVLPLTNRAHSAVRFFAEPVELIQAFYWIEDQNLDIIGIFHSHPNGPETPSETDIREFNYPGAVSVILSNSQTNWQVRAFMIDNGGYREIRLIPDEKP